MTKEIGIVVEDKDGNLFFLATKKIDGKKYIDPSECRTVKLGEKVSATIDYKDYRFE